MKSAVLTGIKKIEVIETEKPLIEKGNQVLLKILSVGICGSDVHYYNHGNIGSQVVDYPYPVGHEASSLVVETGEDVKSLKPGDRVAIEPSIYCGKCDQCIANRRHTCRNLKFLGCPGQIDGCMSEYFVMPDYCCFKVPDSITPQLAVIAEPLSIGLYSTRLSGIDLKGCSIGILGTGPIGLVTLLSCLYQGATNIYTSDIRDYRVEKSLTLGANGAYNPEKVELVAEILSQEKEGLDIVFECCGQQEAINQALELLKPGGTMIVIGIPEERDLSFNMDLMRRKEIKVQNVRRQNNCFEDAIMMITENPEPYQKLITHEFNIGQVAKAFNIASNYDEEIIKGIINF